MLRPAGLLAWALRKQTRGVFTKFEGVLNKQEGGWIHHLSGPANSDLFREKGGRVGASKS
eukprot:8425376-Pyramimonas_sp.AAC.1